MRLGIFLPNWIGDVVMATPALRAIRKHVGPQTHVVGIMRPYVAKVLAGNAWLDEVVLYKKQTDCPEFGQRAVQRTLRAARLDRIVLLTNSMRTAWMAWRSGARERIGYGGNWRSWLLTHPLRLPREVVSGVPLATIDSYLYLASSLGCPLEPPRMELATTPTDEQAADAVWQELDLPSGEKVVVFNSGGAFGLAKDWPAEYFASLARRIVAELDCHVLVNCGPAERDTARDIAVRADDRRVVSLADVAELPLGLSKACIRRGRMLVSTDSGPRFFGIAFGKPVVTLFGPTAPQATRTHYDRETCLSLSLDCQPCMKPVCPLVHHRCMRDLSVDRVFAAVAEHLDTSAGQEAA
jgi:lipopolysaccharide heptosyltransferase II